MSAKIEMNEQASELEKRGASYWSQNKKRLGVLLSIWFLGSYGTSILFVDQLDRFTFFGFPLGFWFSQQGSIYVFLGLTLAYVISMNRLDEEYEKSPTTTMSREVAISGSSEDEEERE